MPDFITEPSRDIPVIARVQVLVCGGGPAGIAAAIAAARAGATTILLERYGHLGGLATGGLVIALPQHDRGSERVMGGVSREFREVLVARGHMELSTWGWDYFDPEALKVISAEKLLDSGARLMLHRVVTAPIMDGPQIRGIIVESKAGREAILADQVVDATGDGDVFARAGAPFSTYRRPIGLPCRFVNVDTEQVETFRKEHTGEYEAIFEQARQASGWTEKAEMLQWQTTFGKGIFWTNNHLGSLDGCDPDVLTTLEVEGRRRLRGLTDYLRAHMPGCVDMMLMETASQLGVRVTRLLDAEAIVRDDDVNHHECPCEGSIGRATNGNRGDCVFDIPLGCLVPPGFPNLLVAGRCVGSEAGDAIEAIRLIHVCWLTGEAAGAEAARRATC
jgi:ribulose 1,5-bisphosphate synthetase/thiazole synthase